MSYVVEDTFLGSHMNEKFTLMKGMEHVDPTTFLHRSYSMSRKSE